MLCSNGQNKTKFADFQQQFDGFFCIYFISVIYDHTGRNNYTWENYGIVG